MKCVGQLSVTALGAQIALFNMSMMEIVRNEITQKMLKLGIYVYSKKYGS